MYKFATDKSTSAKSNPVISSPATSYSSGTNTLQKPGTLVSSAPSTPADPQVLQAGTHNKSTTDAGKNTTTSQESNSKMTWPTASTKITSDYGSRNNPKKTKEKTVAVEFLAGIDIEAVIRNVDGDEV